MSLIIHSKKGLYCPIAKVYIDPWRKVDNALITHGHSDHARHGHKFYVCAEPSVPILKHRLGLNINIRGLAYGETLVVNGVKFSFHPAGHITGSAQIRVEHKGEIWVASGDYKREDDGLCTPYEVVRCHHFITECTFGLPIYQWRPQEEIIEEIKSWWSQNAAIGITSVITAYSLGKAQRIIHSLGSEIGPFYTHETIEKMNTVYRGSGISLPRTQKISESLSHNQVKKALIITPGAAIGKQWPKSIRDYRIGMASGWMALKNNRKRRGADKGFVLSDHCDWVGLNNSISDSGATHIYPTHGNTQIFSKWLNEQGYNAKPIETHYGSAEDKDGQLS